MRTFQLTLWILILTATLASAQSPLGGTPATTTFYFLSGSSIQYSCAALSIQPTPSTFTVTSATAANPGVFTVSGGHNVYWTATDALAPLVFVTGGTGSWAVLNNRYWILSPTAATTFNILDPATGTALNTTGFTGTATVTISTQAPLLNLPRFRVTRFGLDAGGNVISVQNANGGAATTKCSDRAAATTSWQ